jgi:hypothetical protein
MACSQHPAAGAVQQQQLPCLLIAWHGSCKQMLGFSGDMASLVWLLLCVCVRSPSLRRQGPISCQVPWALRWPAQRRQHQASRLAQA